MATDAPKLCKTTLSNQREIIIYSNSLTLVPETQIDDMSAIGEVMAWRRTVFKSLIDWYKADSYLWRIWASISQLTAELPFILGSRIHTNTCTSVT